MKDLPASSTTPVADAGGPAHGVPAAVPRATMAVYPPPLAAPSMAAGIMDTRRARYLTTLDATMAIHPSSIGAPSMAERSMLYLRGRPAASQYRGVATAPGRSEDS